MLANAPEEQWCFCDLCQRITRLQPQRARLKFRGMGGVTGRVLCIKHMELGESEENIPNRFLKSISRQHDAGFCHGPLYRLLLVKMEYSEESVGLRDGCAFSDCGGYIRALCL